MDRKPKLTVLVGVLGNVSGDGRGAFADRVEGRIKAAFGQVLVGHAACQSLSGH